MTKPKIESDATAKYTDPTVPYFIEEEDEHLFPPIQRPYPHYYARDLYEVREGETLMEAMDRVSRESVAAAEAEAEAEAEKAKQR